MPALGAQGRRGWWTRKAEPRGGQPVSLPWVTEAVCSFPTCRPAATCHQLRAGSGLVWRGLKNAPALAQD